MSGNGIFQVRYTAIYFPCSWLSLENTFDLNEMPAEMLNESDLIHLCVIGASKMIRGKIKVGKLA